jgi:glycosyltransferase involved in cell wall biosynthesis
VADVARRPVLIYRETLLAPSEPFITAQAEQLRRHEPWYLALRSVDGHPVPAQRDLRWRTRPLAPAQRYAWKRWGVAPRTTRAVAGVRPVLVHAHFGRDGAQLVPWLRRRPVPLVVTFHGHDVLRTTDDLRAGSYSDRLYLQRWSELLDRGARFLAVSTLIRDRLLDRGAPPDRVELHYIGVDCAAIASYDADPVRRDPDLVLFVGRLVPQKGCLDLIEALARVRATGRPLRLAVVGSGPERERCERRAAELGVPAELVGPCRQAEVWAWMRRAAVVAVPSRTGTDGWKEAFGLVAAEGQAAGARVVASTCGGLPEAIAPANHDLLFPEADVDALADRLARATEPDDDWGSLAREAADWIRTHRDLVRQTARLDAIYEEVAP